MTFFDLLKNRRSTRQYSDRKIEQEKIDKLTAAALMSPSSKRSNPWEFIVVEDKETLAKLSESRPHGSQMLSQAPLGIVVIADRTRSDVWMEDASIAALIIQLQAQDMGLGSCWTQIYLRQKEEDLTAEEYIRNLLEIPEKYAVLCIISVGYKNEDRPPHNEEKLAYNKIHREKFN
ncbi:MAG: nitroreductase family protein [Paludibacteraceae bacterium]